MKYSNEIYELLEITPKNEEELKYLIKLSNKFDILEKAKNQIFGFSPTYDENGRNQTFGVFYKESLIFEIVYYLISKVAEIKKFNKCENKTEKEIKIEDFTNYFYDEVLNEKEKNQLIEFILKNNLSGKKNNEIINIFYNKNKEYFKKYEE